MDKLGAHGHFGCYRGDRIYRVHRRGVPSPAAPGTGLKNFAIAFGNAATSAFRLSQLYSAEAAFYVVSYSTLVNLLQ